MSLSPEASQAMVLATYDTAVAMIEDLQHMREVTQMEVIRPDDIRRLCNPIRRILTDNNGDLRKVSPPRVGKVMLQSYDLKSVYKRSEKEPYVFFYAGKAHIFGLEISCLSIGKVVPNEEVKISQDLFDLSIDGFLQQKVICQNGFWITRADVIKYIAYVAHGVHSGDPQSEGHARIKRVRQSYRVCKEDGNICFDVAQYVEGPKTWQLFDGELEPKNGAIDIILIQLLSIAYALTNSPDMLRLEEIISRERASRELASQARLNAG